MDALFASVQMPLGAPVATVGVDRGENGAILASQIIGIHNKDVRDNLSNMRQEFFFKVDKDEEKLEDKLNGDYYYRDSFINKSNDNKSEVSEVDFDDESGEIDVAVIAGSYSDINVAKKLQCSWIKWE